MIPADGNLSFDDLLMRIHPAASRILKLSKSAPAFSLCLICWSMKKAMSLVENAAAERREAPGAFAREFVDAPHRARLRLSPYDADLAVARKWFHMGVGLDGIVAKRTDLPYQTGERTGMQKIKKQRTADCVVGGFRYLEKKPLVGSLLLGLFNGEGFSTMWDLLPPFRRRSGRLNKKTGKDH